MNVLPPVTEATFAAFIQAWNQHDVNALMSFMADDCVFEAAAGPEAFGNRIETDGVDLFAFRDGKILSKKAFRKDRPTLPASLAAQA